MSLGWRCRSTGLLQPQWSVESQQGECWSVDRLHAGSGNSRTNGSGITNDGNLRGRRVIRLRVYTGLSLSRTGHQCQRNTESSTESQHACPSALWKSCTRRFPSVSFLKMARLLARGRLCDFTSFVRTNHEPYLLVSMQSPMIAIFCVSTPKDPIEQRDTATNAPMPPLSKSAADSKICASIGSIAPIHREATKRSSWAARALAGTSLIAAYTKFSIGVERRLRRRRLGHRFVGGGWLVDQLGRTGAAAVVNAWGRTCTGSGGRVNYVGADRAKSIPAGHGACRSADRRQRAVGTHTGSHRRLTCAPAKRSRFGRRGPRGADTSNKLGSRPRHENMSP